MTAPRPSEKSIHFAVAGYLNLFLDPDWRCTHIPNGEHRDRRTAAKLKRMGVKSGWPDFILVSPRGQTYFMELKRVGGRLSESQNDYRAWCIKLGIPYVVAYSLDEAIAALKTWGCVRE